MRRRNHRQVTREDLTEQFTVRFSRRAAARLRAKAAGLGNTPCAHIRACVEAVDSRDVRPAAVMVKGAGRPEVVALGGCSCREKASCQRT
jgi:hypothetical protein